jgi:serine kinase of HPr protein (carbohydrate metabolism regulator)
VIDIHATTVEIGGVGVLLRGPSGSGKSDLALRLLDAGARLVADDRTFLRREGGRVVASAPATIAGRLEVRGIGIMTVPAVDAAVVGLVVDLVAGPVERLPELCSVRLLEVDFPLVRLAPFEASAVAKLRLAARALAG